MYGHLAGVTLSSFPGNASRKMPCPNVTQAQWPSRSVCELRSPALLQCRNLLPSNPSPNLTYQSPNGSNCAGTYRLLSYRASDGAEPPESRPGAEAFGEASQMARSAASMDSTGSGSPVVASKTGT